MCSGESHTLITFGIISAAFLIKTLSPILISNLLISSKLCKLALETTLPARLTGSRTATGVIAPVFPTPSSISLNVVEISSGGNLKAVAHFGALEVYPSSL